MLAACASVLALGVLTLTALPASGAELRFPYTNTFDSADGGVLSGDARIVDGRLRLTDDENAQAGAWSSTDSFPSTRGLEIEFDYAVYSDAPYAGADGLLLYLADGAAAPGVGGTGAALGYACRSESTQGSGPCTTPGIPGGFAAIALDQYGNFSLPINGSGPGARPDSVVVRGSGNGTDGYRYVVGALAPGRVPTDGPTTRTVRISLVPGPAGELSVTVRVEQGGVMRTALADVPLHGDGQAALPDTLRLGFAGATGALLDVHEIDSLRVWQPADLRVVHDMPATATTGAGFEYAVTATNVGVNDSDPSPVEVDVPDGLADVTWTCRADGAGSCGDAVGTGDVATDLDLPRGGSATMTITGRVSDAASGELVSEADITTAPGLADVDESDNTSRASSTVTDAAALTTDKSVSPAVDVAPGDEVEYAITARNDGPGTARQVGAVDELPAAMAFAGSDDDCSAAGQLVTCRSDDDLEVGGAHTFRIRAVVDPAYRGDGSDVVNVATATSPTDPDGGDPSPEVPIEVVVPDEPGPAGPEPTGSPSVRPTSSPTAATGGAGRGGGAPGARGPGVLAYTGSDGVLPIGVAAIAATVIGLGIRRTVLRRRGAPEATED